MNKSTVHSPQSTVKILALTPLSAILLSLAFSSFNLDYLVWFAFVPFFFALDGKNKLQSFLISYICGFLFFLLSMYWLIHVTTLGWILLSLYQAIYFAAFGITFAFLIPRPSSLVPLSSAWVLLEYIRSNLFGGIGWNLLGYSQYKNLPLIQIADITGVYGVSFLIIVINIAVYKTIKMAIKCYTTDSKFKIKTAATFTQDLKAHPVMQTLVVLILFIITLAYGYFVIASPDGTIGAKQSQLKISVIQGNIEQKFKWDEEYRKYIMDRYEDLTIQVAKDKPQLIIWPETAVPGFLNYDKELLSWIKNLIEKIKTPLIAGMPMLDENDPNKYYNAAVLFTDKADILAQYNKLHLVAFGEFIPFEKQFRFLRKLFPISGDFLSGKEYTIFKLPANFGVLICFEDIFPNIVRKFVKKGACFMVNITNDAWFGKSAAAYQHAANSVFRAVENKRPFIRSANTGFSCFIDKFGRIYEKVSKNGKDLFVDGIKTAIVDIYTDKKLTFYTKFGDIFILGCIILLTTNICRKVRIL